MDFRPFEARDFDAFLDEKWCSNAFNRERLEVKQNLLALGRRLGPVMVMRDGAPLECEVSAEHPAVWNQRSVENQHLFFSRTRASREELELQISKRRTMAALIEDPSPLRNHIFLSVMIDKSQLEAALKLHSDAAVDRENLQRKCQEYFQREKLLALLNGLPPEFEVGIQGRPTHVAADLDDDQLQRLVQDLSGADSWFVVRRSRGRDDPLLQDPEVVELLKRDLGALLPLLDFIAWSRDNDHVSMRDTLKQHGIKQRARGVARNDRVRVVRGVFSGKTGVVEETDAKGGIKARLGSMLVKLDRDDVVKA